MNNLLLPSEWALQSAILMAWPHEQTDWAYMLNEVQACYRDIIATITRFEDVILLVPNQREKEKLAREMSTRVRLITIKTNDTWARDFGPIFIKNDKNFVALDFKFNGWGLKYAADKDNLINQQLFKTGLFNTKVNFGNRLNFVLEGGALETDGEGTLLTTTHCLLSPNRNGEWTKEKIDNYLKKQLGLSRVLWLNHGYLAGDDTDSHIDTLARFCTPNTIAYVQCNNSQDEHYEALQKMECELKTFKTATGEPYNLIPLPMADEIIVDDERLPATYANFLIVNNAVLVPTYGSNKDQLAIKSLKTAFPKHTVQGVNCLPLIKQHGSLHCITMQLPLGCLI
ncbi:agmatine deiminase family protein [Geofilum sp. OHC36d9]|uniref:agmatine deiminase family protein n=1 Tax=Geofilum sp. OHC36d9 TaxID=3458413 RepID=UPI0040338385